MEGAVSFVQGFGEHAGRVGHRCKARSFPLIQIFKFSNIYSVTIEWQLTSLIFIEKIQKAWAAVNLGSRLFTGAQSVAGGGA